jgi:transcriptional regulator with XRE-family HTH domain
MVRERPLDERRNELGDFLRKRRAALAPEDVGLPSGARRRTPGLRREEVAELAQISVALYTWLEQGREVPVSRRAIDAIARALRLTPAEHRHLHYLALQEEVDLRDIVSPSLDRLVASFVRHPIFVLDRAWNVIRRNAAARAVFGGPDDLAERFNMLEVVFVDAMLRDLFVDYEQIIESLIAMYRLDFPAHAMQSESRELVERLRATYPLFEELWQRYSVREAPVGLRRLDHPIMGPISFESSLLGVVESPGLRLMMYRPENEETANRIARLVADHRPLVEATP